jgi:hypothetical protein
MPTFVHPRQWRRAFNLHSLRSSRAARPRGSLGRRARTSWEETSPSSAENLTTPSTQAGNSDNFGLEKGLIASEPLGFPDRRAITC